MTEASTTGSPPVDSRGVLDSAGAPTVRCGRFGRGRRAAESAPLGPVRVSAGEVRVRQGAGRVRVMDAVRGAGVMRVPFRRRVDTAEGRVQDRFRAVTPQTFFSYPLPAAMRQRLLDGESATKGRVTLCCDRRSRCCPEERRQAGCPLPRLRSIKVCREGRAKGASVAFRWAACVGSHRWAAQITRASSVQRCLSGRQRRWSPSSVQPLLRGRPGRTERSGQVRSTRAVWLGFASTR